MLQIICLALMMISISMKKSGMMVTQLQYVHKKKKYVYFSVPSSKRKEGSGTFVSAVSDMVSSFKEYVQCKSWSGHQWGIRWGFHGPCSWWKSETRSLCLVFIERATIQDGKETSNGDEKKVDFNVYF